MRYGVRTRRTVRHFGPFVRRVAVSVPEKYHCHCLVVLVGVVVMETCLLFSLCNGGGSWLQHPISHGATRAFGDKSVASRKTRLCSWPVSCAVETPSGRRQDAQNRTARHQCISLVREARLKRIAVPILIPILAFVRPRVGRFTCLNRLNFLLLIPISIPISILASSRNIALENHPLIPGLSPEKRITSVG